jgi:hypothetical protein
MAITGIGDIGRMPAPAKADPFKDAVLADSPAAYYRLNDGSGATTVADESGAGRDGTWQGSPAFGAGLFPGDLGNWDGDGSVWAEVNAVAPEIYSGDFTIELFAYGDAANICAVGWNDSSGDANVLDIFAPPSDNFLVTGSNTPYTNRDFLARESAIYHVVVKNEGGSIRVFVNGVEDTVEDFPASFAGAPASDDQISIGQEFDGASVSNVHSGKMSDVAFYGYALSDSRILAHYEASQEVSFANLSIAIITKDPTHDAPNNTKAALESRGHSVTVYDDSSVTASEIESHDVGVLVRYANWSEASTAYNNGQPMLVGITQNSDGTGFPCFTSANDLSSTEDLYTQGANGETFDFLAVDHPIKNGFSLPGLFTPMTGINWSASWESGAATHAGTLLGEGTAGNDADGRGMLFVFEAGATDLASNTIPARVALWGHGYGGQNAYSEEGADLLDRLVNWLLG